VGWGGYSIPLGCYILLFAVLSRMGIEDKHVLGVYVDCCCWGNLEIEEPYHL